MESLWNSLPELLASLKFPISTSSRIPRLEAWPHSSPPSLSVQPSWSSARCKPWLKWLNLHRDTASKLSSGATKDPGRWLSRYWGTRDWAACSEDWCPPLWDKWLATFFSSEATSWARTYWLQKVNRRMIWVLWRPSYVAELVECLFGWPRIHLTS